MCPYSSCGVVQVSGRFRSPVCLSMAMLVFFFLHKLNWRILQTRGWHHTSSIETSFILFSFIYFEVFGQSQASIGWNSFPAWNWNVPSVSINTGLSSNWVKLQVWLNYSFQSNPVSKLKNKLKVQQLQIRTYSKCWLWNRILAAATGSHYLQNNYFFLFLYNR